MSDTTMMHPGTEASGHASTFKLKGLVGSGDRIMLFTLAFLGVGLLLNYLFPALFGVRELSGELSVLVWAVLIAGVAIWLWSVVLILTRVPKGELITSGPFAVVKHPLYTAVALLVIPAAGLLLGSWLGVLIGVAMYAGSRMFAPREEQALAETFGAQWDEYCEKVMIPWL